MPTLILTVAFSQVWRMLDPQATGRVNVHAMRTAIHAMGVRVALTEVQLHLTLRLLTLTLPGTLSLTLSLT